MNLITLKNQSGLLRKAEPSDLDEIMRLENDCFDQAIVESRSVYAERISVFSEGFLVLEAQGALIGFICSELWPHQGAITQNAFSLGHSIKERFSAEASDLYVSSLAVAPNQRGKAYGKLLLETLIKSLCDKFPSLRRCILLVGAQWPQALELYRKNGFVPLAEFDHFFTDKNNAAYKAYILIKTL